MDSEQLIKYATAAAGLALKAIERANDGDPKGAQAFLEQMRGEWDEAAEAWAAAPGPGDEPT